MSEIVTARDETTGQFVPCTEGMFGQELENAKAGFTTKPKDPPPEETSDDPVRQAASDLAARRKEAVENISVTEIMGVDPDRDPQEARTVQQAADEYGSARTAISKYAEGIDLSNLAQKVDEDRAKVVDGDKDRAKHLGFELKDAEPKSDAKADIQAAPVDDQVDAETAAAIDAVEGLDETTKRALKIPQVRAAIEQQLGEVDTARQQLATERALAQQFAQASFLEGFPELAALAPEHLEAGLQQLAQQNPARFQQAMGVLNRVQVLQASAQQQQAEQAREHQHQIETWARSQDERLKSFGVELTPAITNEVAEYARQELGIDRNQLGQILHANPILRSAEFTRVIVDATRYRQAGLAKATISARPLPPVQRPGVQQDRVRPEVANIAGLQKQLSEASGNKALRIAAQIKSAQRKARP